VIRRAGDAGVFKIVNIGYDLDGSDGALRLAESYDALYAAVGVHPHNAKTVNAAALKQLETLSRCAKVVAIGEIGLDFYRRLSPQESQIDAFQSQLSLAKERGLPVVIHVRDAYQETYDLLSKYAGDVQGIMHCWSGSTEMARRYLDLGFHISIAGPVTYRSARKLVDVVTKLPIDRLVVETDSPWLAPQAHRGHRNEPSFLPEIVERIASMRGIAADDLAKQTSENACRLLDMND
jgi:TatD DNase family protein